MALVPLAPDRQDSPAGGACGAVHEGLDRLESELDALAVAEGVSAGDLGRVMRELTRLVNRAQALHDKGAAIAERIDVAARTGARSTGQWLATVTSVDPRTAHRQAARAAEGGLAAPTDAGPGLGLVPAEAADAAPRLTATGRAQLAEDLSREHVDVIQRCLTDLPDTTSPDVRAACETELIRLARGRSPRELRRQAARVLERVGTPQDEVDAHEHAQTAAAEDAAWERASFWIRDNGDGTMHGQFTLPTLAGQTLKTILDAMCSPRRADARHGAAPGAHTSRGDDTASSHGAGSHGAESTSVREEPPAWLDRSLDPRTRQLARQQRHGQDLATLLTHLPTDHLHDKTAATVLVTTRLSDLQDQTPRVATTAGGHPLTPGQARQLACQATIIPAILDTDSAPLDLGRQSRFFTKTQRAALALTYDTCATAGCDIPFAWTETHHLHPWASGGTTDLANAVPLCGHHHRALDRGYQHTLRRDDQQITIELARRRT